MEFIIVGFSTPKVFNPFSWLIKKIQKTKFSHVYIRFHSNAYNRDLVYQASGLKVNFISWKKFQEIESIFAEFPIEIDLHSKQLMIQYCLDQVGKDYDTKGIFGIGIVFIYKMFNKHIKNPFANKEESFFCSKLAEYILQDFLHQNVGIDPDLVTPKDIYEYLEKHCG